MKWLKRLFWILLLIGVIAGAYFSLQPQPIAIDTAEVVRGPLEVTVDEDGKTRIKEKYIVSTPVGGRLRRIEFREGDKVYANETVLASIEPSDPDLLDARALAQAKARVNAAESAVDRANSRHAQTKVQLDQAQRDLKRGRELIESRAISLSEFEKIEANFRSLDEQLHSAEFDQEISNFELELAKAALVRVQPVPEDGTATEESLADFNIRAPVDGVVLRVLQESSTIVTPGTPIVELGDPTDLEIVVDVLSTDAVKLAAGTKVYLEQWGGDKSLAGVVRLIEPSAYEKISALGVEEQRVDVIIDFDESPENLARLGDGYRVEAKMVTWKADEVTKIPTSALFRDKNVWSVFIVDEGIARLTPVEVGHRNDREAEISSGLESGQTVILHPGDNLFDGSKVIPRENGK